MKQLIYVVDDEKNIRELLTYNLCANGYEVDAFENGEDFLIALEKSKPDLICLDIMLPDYNGLELCKIIRSDKGTKHIPVIMITAKTTEFDTIVGLESGADDYLKKPFSVNELIARVRAQLRRSIPLSEEEKTHLYQIKDLIIDMDKREIKKEGITLKLTLKEYELLKLLALGKGKVYSRESLLNEVWGYDYYGDGRTVDVHIHNIRKILNDEAEDYLVTVRGVGYRFNG